MGNDRKNWCLEVGETRKFLEWNLHFHCKGLLEALGADLEDSSMSETPQRMVKYMMEVFEGQLYSNEEIAKMFDKQFEIGSDDLVIVKDITVFSHCEHHGALMYDGKIAIAYLPVDGKVLGLSKFARIAELVCKRFQVQERIVKDIAEVLELLGMKDFMVVMYDTKHACMTTRGVKNYTSKTDALLTRGEFRQKDQLEDRVLRALGL
jgi:GTP cyclohydrolase I